MFRKLLTYVMIQIFIVLSINSFAQNFDGTTLSSTKPFYGEFPYHYEESEYFMISFKTDANVIRSLVPEPLVPTSDEMKLFFAKQKVVDPVKLNYNEVFLSIPVSLDTINGGYIPVLYLDKVEVIIPGREIWGFNKVDAEIVFTGDEQNVLITVTQRDTLIIKASFTLGEPFVPPQRPQRERGLFNLKYIPSVVRNALPDVYQLTTTISKESIPDARESKTKLARTGEAQLEFFPSYYNPLYKIPVLEKTGAMYSINSFSLTNGEVIYDYLKEE